MAFRLSDFWRWGKTDSSRYNALVADIAAWRPDELEAYSVLTRHLNGAPSFMVTDHNDSPEAVGAALAPEPTCEVSFTPSAVKGGRVFAVGFFWPEYNVANPVDNQPSANDWEFKITTGLPYVTTYDGEDIHVPVYGHTQAFWDPLGVDVSTLRWGGAKCQITTLTLDTFVAGTTKIALFAPPIYGRALLMVLAEDNL